MIEWRAWPARKKPLRSIFAGMVVLACVAWAQTVHPWVGAGVAVAMLGAIGEVLLPTHYRLDGEGVRCSSLTHRSRKPWTDFVSFRPMTEGFYLHSRHQNSWLRRRRSRFLYCFNDAEAVHEYLSTRLERNDPQPQNR